MGERILLWLFLVVWSRHLKVGGILYYEKIDLNDFDEGDILVYQTKEHIISHTELWI